MTIIVADDHRLVRDMICEYLRSTNGLDQDGILEAASFQEMIEVRAQAANIRLVIMDYVMPGASGLSSVREAVSVFSGIPVVLMSGTADSETALAAIKAGAAGFIPKTIGMKSFVDAVRVVLNGEKFIHEFVLGGISPSSDSSSSSQRTKLAVTPAPDESLHPAEGGSTIKDIGDSGFSSREIQVARLMMDGKTNKEIARALNLHEMTVKTHLRSIFRRIGASNRTEAAKILNSLI